MRTLKNLPSIYKIIFKYTPLYGVISIIEALFASLFNIIFNLIFLKTIADMVIEGYYFNDILPYIFFVLGLLIIATILKHGKNYTKELGEVKISSVVDKKVFEKAVSIDLEAFEDMNLYNKIILSLKEIDRNIIGYFEHSIRLIFLMTNLIGTITIVTVISPIYLVIFFFAIAINFLALLLEKNILYKHSLEITELNRHGEYINRIFYKPEFIKEVKSYGMKNELIDKYIKNMDKQEENINNYRFTLLGLDIFNNFFASAFMIDGLLMIKIAYDVVVKKILSVGSVITMIRAISNLQWLLSDITTNISNLALKNKYINIYKNFLLYENKVINGKKSICFEEVESLELKNVWFKYPYSNKYILKDISMTINPRDKIGLIGRNGAGKSTLIKLLLRFYDPDKGEILLNGTNIKDYKLKEYRGLFYSVFQNYNVYPATIKDNILLGNEPDNLDVAVDILSMENLNNGIINLETYLNKEIYENATDLSGGERQKLAISRSMIGYKNKFMFIYDEPNSYLDAMSEYEISKKLKDRQEGKSSLTISHRLATIQDSDIIYLLENGEIKEKGTHNELMALDGSYTLMYNIQSKRYIEHIR